MADSMKVPFLDIASQQAEIADEVSPVWNAQFASAGFIGGPEVTAFEQEYAAYIGVEHVVGVSNGTDALELAFRAVGVGPGPRQSRVSPGQDEIECVIGVSGVVA